MATPTSHLLIELKRLRHERGETSPFPSLTAFLQWADQVEPLLNFHPEFLQSFKRSVSAAKLVHGSSLDNTRGINEAIGTVNKAIALLETQAVMEPAAPTIDPKPTDIEYPPKLTLKWLYEHAPWSFYVWFFGALSASFVVGFTASEIRTAMNSSNFSNAAPTTTPPIKANAVVKSPSAASSVIVPQK